MRRYIDADALTKYIDRTIPKEVSGEFWKGAVAIRHIIQIQPTADVRPNVKGYWRYETTSSELRSCSVCGYTTHAVGVYEPHQTAFPQRILFNYCPCCGADMRGGGE